MRYFLILLFICPQVVAFAQDNKNNTVNLDLLRAPASPAFQALGIAPSVVERPTDLNDLRIALQNASSGLTKLPSDFSLEIAPANFFNTGGLTLSKFDTARFRDLFWQSFSVSSAVTHGTRKEDVSGDDLSFLKLGLGIKFSLLRPRWTDETRKAYKKIYHALAAANACVENRMREDETLKKATIEKFKIAANPSLSDVEKKWKLDSIDGITGGIKERILEECNKNPEIMGAISAAITGFRIDRQGAFIDFASGTALDFPDNRLNNSLVSRAGAWLTGGYIDSEKGISSLAVFRYLYQPDKIFADDSKTLKTADISTFDAGFRLIYTAKGGKFSVSMEGIYRSVLNKNTLDPNWRYTLNADYDIGQNRRLTFAFGKNFDGTLSKGGNLIAAINFIAGFGSSKRL